ANGGPLTPELLARQRPGAAPRRWRPLRDGNRGTDLQGLVRQLVRLGIQTLPEGTLERHVVGAVERELIEQVLRECNGVQTTAAKRLGINRNTLHKKVSEIQPLDAGLQRSE